MLKSLNKEALQKEKEIQENIYKCIEKFKSFVFYAGAGAGKTYALKESLRYLLKHKREELKRKNQKIICITYTNVAVNEIKRRIGNTELVLVSTIHERMWDFIKSYQTELILIHKEKLEKEIKNLQEKVEQDSFYNSYLNKDELKQLIFENVEELKQLQSLKAKEYKNKVKELISVTFSNVGNFKKLVNNIIKIGKYKEAIKQINNGEVKKVEYAMLYNSDRLEKMKFSHDTLLEYALQMVKKYQNLQRILVDKYPYIFVDEFQDTNENVIKLLKLLFDYSKEKNKNFLIGYFGDAYQKIYSDGVGKEIIQESYLQKIDKKFNRRSTNEIIYLINKIRDDNLKQESIYTDANGGKVEITFGSGEIKNVQEHINSICKNYNIHIENKLHILFLTNKLIAQFAGFEEFYSILNDFIYYNDLTTQMMSKDTTKLHEIVLYIFHLLKIYDVIKNKKQVNEILKKQDLKDISLYQYKQDISRFNLDNVRTFADLFELFITHQTILMQRIKKKYLKIDSLEELIMYFAEKLSVADEKLDTLEKLMNLDINILMNWYKYITSTNENKLQKLIYHTYHSTKGEEYDNVLIVMENDFGKKRKNVIKNFFINPNECDEDIINLLYVSFSRAKKNLFVYYIDDNLNESEKLLINNFIKNTKKDSK